MNLILAKDLFKSMDKFPFFRKFSSGKMIALTKQNRLNDPYDQKKFFRFFY